MLDLFKAARGGFVPLPPRGRLSIIHADDLARLLLALAIRDPGRVILEADDGAEGGWTHGAFARAIGAAVGHRVAVLSPHPGRLRAEVDAQAFGLDDVASTAFRQTVQRLHRLLFEEASVSVPVAGLEVA